ncbi:MAG: glycosyltransferase family 2 protein, partial [Flavobacteriales bacterium]
GALANGHEMAKGEFIAIFDADFIPESNFLQNTLPAFSDSKVGLVQTRWEHINEKYSFLTRLQAFGLDAHFSIEQKGRNNAGHFMNFNGTAGVWRKQCIDDAGGWNADTLTEDLDLSYRAQMNGWKFKFLEEVGAPAELPAAMNALKTQQYRWNKGAAECMRKNLPKVLKSKGVQLKTKLHAIFHLMNSFIFLSILSIAFLSIPILVIKSTHPEYQFLFKYATIFILSFFFLTLFYWTSVFKTYKSYGKKLKNTLEFIYLFPLFITVSMGMSLHNGIAVLEGYIGKKSPFIRTPKFNIKKAGDNWKKNKYLIKVLHPLTFLEGFLTLYFFSGIFIALTLGDFDFLPFHIMLTLGFGYVFYYSVKHSKVANN